MKFKDRNLRTKMVEVRGYYDKQKTTRIRFVQVQKYEWHCSKRQYLEAKKRAGLIKGDSLVVINEDPGVLFEVMDGTEHLVNIN